MSKAGSQLENPLEPAGSSERAPGDFCDLKLAEARAAAEQSGPGAAIECLRLTLVQSPEFVAGWQQLADWYRVLQDHDGLLEATEQLAHLQPDDAPSLAAYGEALARCGRRADAEQQFALALQLDGGFTFAGFWLFDLLLTEERFADAKRILERLRAHGAGGPFVLARQTQLSAATGDRPLAKQHLAAICLGEGDIRWPLNAAARAFRSAGWRFDLREILEASLRKPDVHPEVGALWMRVSVMDGCVPSDFELRELADRHAAGRQAIATIGDALCETGHGQQAVDFVLRNRDWLREPTLFWGMGSFVLASQQQYRHVLSWMADWRDRDDAEAWMLFNLVEAMRAIGDDAQARQVGEHALTLAPDHAHDLHRIWLVFDRPFEQPDLLEYVGTATLPETLSDGPRFLYALASAMFDAGVAGHRQLPFAHVRDRVSRAIESYRPHLKREPGHRRVLMKTIRQIAACYDGWTPRMWRLFRRFY